MRLLSSVIFFLVTAGAFAEEIEIRRHSSLTDEELRKQLLLAPEAGFNQPRALYLYKSISNGNQILAGRTGNLQAGAGAFPMSADIGPHFAIRLDPSMVWMPWHSGVESQLGREPAEALHVLSLKLRSYLRSSTSPDDFRPDPDKLRAILNGKVGDARKPTTSDSSMIEWQKPEAVATLVQLLQAENGAIRTVLVEALAEIEGPEASAALANRAIFDLSFAIRKKSIEALAKRPTVEYQGKLLSGLKYPWLAATSHAAEALAALRVTTAAADLVLLLKEPDPWLPFKDKNGTLVREVLKVNHLSNCMVCHAPSKAQDDLVRGSVPVPGENPAPAYYQSQNGLFVRADTTFLKQDFSVMQPVPNSGTWQGNQRFDYLTRARPATAAEIKIAQTLAKDGKIGQEYKEAVLFALRAITGRDAGSTPEAWEGLQMGIRKTNVKAKQGE